MATLTPVFMCECENQCERTISPSAWAALDEWRAEHDHDDLYIVSASCAAQYEVLQRYGAYCVIRDSA